MEVQNPPRESPRTGLNRFGGPPNDAEELALLLFRGRENLLHRVRRRLGSAWPAIDPDDLFSSGLRRVHLQWVRGTFAGADQSQFWAIVITTFLNIARNKAALGSWLRSEKHADLNSLAARLETAASDEHAWLFVHRVFMSLRTDAERELLLLKLRGHDYGTIAVALGCSEVAARQRWTTVCRQLRATFVSQESPNSE